MCEDLWFCIGSQEGPASHGRLMATTEAELALSVLYATFSPSVLDCVVVFFFFFMETLIPTCSDRSIWTSTPGDRHLKLLAGQIFPPSSVHTGIC